jgi:hypothetical protein
MSEFKGTPGPWDFRRLDWRGNPSGYKLYVSGDVSEPEEGISEGSATAVCVVEGNATAGEIPLANARLIAAAPDLLAACEEARRVVGLIIPKLVIDADPGAGELLDLLDAAVAKAREAAS